MARWSAPGDAISFDKALAGGKNDRAGGGHYFGDSAEDRWWTWDTPQPIEKRFPAAVGRKNMRGMFAWGLREDALSWAHLRALNAGYQRHEQMGGNEDKSSGSSNVAEQRRNLTSNPGFSSSEYKDGL